MTQFQNRNFFIIAGLVLLMAFTRFNHFGSSVSLPDASLAVFFLGGLYLARFSGATFVFAALLIEAALVDYYAISVHGTSDWCVTAAYGFLAVAYAAMWFAGLWFAPRHDFSSKNTLELFGVATVASATAFFISNISFFLFSGYYAEMSAFEYASRVAEYFGSYILFTLLYIGSFVFAYKLYAQLKNKSVHDSHTV